MDLRSFFANPDPAVFLNADPDPALKKWFDFFKTLLKITGSLQEFTLLTPISTEIITKLLKCKVNPWSWSKFSSKEMDYHCIEKPYILFLVQY